MIMKWSDLQPGDQLKINPEHLEYWSKKQFDAIDYFDVLQKCFHAVGVIKRIERDEDIMEIFFQNGAFSIDSWIIHGESGKYVEAGLVTNSEPEVFMLVGLAKKEDENVDMGSA